MNMIFVLIIALFLGGCGDFDLPELPDCENLVEDVDPVIFDIEQSPDEQSETGALIVATAQGYDVPFSGKVYFGENENTEGILEVKSKNGLGSSTGADIAVSTWENGFMAVGRHDSSTIYFFTQNESGTGFNFKEYIDNSGYYLNFQEAVYNPFKQEFIISALNSNSLIILKDSVKTELSLGVEKNISPSKMKVIGNKLFVALQYLDEQWQSQSGALAQIDLENYSVEIIKLPIANPVGKIEHNQRVDKNNIYIACAGKWQKRDGAILRVDLETKKAVTILKESEKSGSLLDGDFVDMSISDDGNFYIVFSDNSERWLNKLLKFETASGKIMELDRGVNAFAANPIEYSSVTKRIYYFSDAGSQTYLSIYNTDDGTFEKVKLNEGPAAVKVWKRKNH